MKRAPLPVLAQGDSWLVVAKPPKLIVHRTAMSSDRIAALQWVRDQVGKRVYPVHRIDRAASGCLLMATDRDVSGALHGAMRQPDADKRYLALVRGCIPAGSETRIERELDGKKSTTDVVVLGSMPEPRCSLVSCRIHTGRFHQVRRHLAGIGHPILGDSHHGDTRVNRWWRENRGLPRLALHGWRLAVPLPDDPVDARCPIWPDLARLMHGLEFWTEAIAGTPELADAWEIMPPWSGLPRGETKPDHEPIPETD